MILSKKININMLQMDILLNPTLNFDIIKREILIGKRKALIYYIDGFLKDSNMQEILKFLLLIKEDINYIKKAEDFVKKYITYPEILIKNEFESIVNFILSGSVALFIDGLNEVIIIDVRDYPQRQIEEPEKDKVLRGAKDGFGETPIQNVTLLRRRIRSKNLCIEYMSIGTETNNDVIICYMKNNVNNKMLKKVLQKLKNINAKSLTMGSQSLIEELVKAKWYNPFPKVRYTQRPDVATANVLEGRIVVFVDNSPSAIILPTYLFDFFSEAEDFYFSPIVATFLKISRICIHLLTIYITPIWLLLVNNIELLPDYLSFINIKEQNTIPILIQLLILEFTIEVIKVASVNTPNMISSSISLIGTIIIGDIAVTTKIIVPEAMLYTAFVTLGYYSQSSFELGYAAKYMRIMLLFLVSIFNIFGLIAGILIIVLIIISNKTVTEDSYIYPIFPFNKKDFANIFIRKKVNM